MISKAVASELQKNTTPFVVPASQILEEIPQNSKKPAVILPPVMDPAQLKGFIENVVVQTLHQTKVSEVPEHPKVLQKPQSVVEEPGSSNLGQRSMTGNSNEQLPQKHLSSKSKVPSDSLNAEVSLGKRVAIPLDQPYVPPAFLHDVPFLKMLYEIQTRNVPASKRSSPYADFSMFAYEIANEVAQSAEIRAFLTKMHIGRQEISLSKEDVPTEIEKHTISGFKSTPTVSPQQSKLPQTGPVAAPNRFESVLDRLKGVSQLGGHQSADQMTARENPQSASGGVWAAPDSASWAKRLPETPRFVETNASVPSARSSVNFVPQK